MAKQNNLVLVGKLKFLRCYAKAKRDGLTKKNIKSGFRTASLYPTNRQKILNNPLVQKAGEIQEAAKALLHQRDPITSGINCSKNVAELFKKLIIDTLNARMAIRFVGKAMDERNIEITLRDREIECLKAEIERMALKRRKKVPQDLNDRLISMEEVLADRISYNERFQRYTALIRKVQNLEDDEPIDYRFVKVLVED